MSGRDNFEALITSVVNCGYQLHREIGPGLLESVYEILLMESIREAGFFVERQVVVPIKYKGVVLDNAFRADLIVERKLLIELKSTERNSAIYGKQVLTYLRLLDIPVGISVKQPSKKASSALPTAIQILPTGATPSRLSALA